LVEAVRLLASPFPDQVEAFPPWVNVADEVALTFDDAFEALDRSATPGSVLHELTVLDGLLRKMSRDPLSANWLPVGLEDGESWAAVRGVALRALREMGVPYDKPRLDSVRFVQAPAGKQST
jgi:hypothetical protein